MHGGSGGSGAGHRAGRGTAIVEGSPTLIVYTYVCGCVELGSGKAVEFDVRIGERRRHPQWQLRTHLTVGCGSSAFLVPVTGEALHVGFTFGPSMCTHGSG